MKLWPRDQEPLTAVFLCACLDLRTPDLTAEKERTSDRGNCHHWAFTESHTGEALLHTFHPNRSCTALGFETRPPFSLQDAYSRPPRDVPFFFLWTCQQNMVRLVRDPTGTDCKGGEKKKRTDQADHRLPASCDRKPAITHFDKDTHFNEEHSCEDSL